MSWTIIISSPWLHNCFKHFKAAHKSKPHSVRWKCSFTLNYWCIDQVQHVFFFFSWLCHKTVITSCTLSSDAMPNMMCSRSPRRRRSRSSSHSRRCRPEHSRSRESRWRSRSRERSERENNRERRQKGLPSIKSQSLSGMCHSKQNQICDYHPVMCESIFGKGWCCSCGFACRIVCSTTLWIGQLDKKTQQSDVVSLLEEFGQIESINVSLGST